MIAAIGKNNELGKGNELIWKIKEDLQFFKEKTLNKDIVMGYNTFKSLPGLLPKRKHIILTRKNIEIDNTLVIHTKEELLDYIINKEEEIFIIGGEALYTQMLDYASKMYLTEIDDYCKDADKFYPKFNKEEWDRTILSSHKTDDNISYKHLVYRRK